MNGSSEKPKAVANLRWRAEEIVREQGISPPRSHSALSRQEALRLLHELRVHQIELRMQNDELSRARTQLNAARERYFDLYNLAPVGYFIVSHEGRILETNLAGANLLKVARAALVKQPITRFILKEDQDVYYLHRKELLATGQAHTCEVRMVKADGTVFWVRLAATSQRPLEDSEPSGTPMSRVVLSDISEQKQIEQAKARLDTQTARAQRRLQVGATPRRGKAGSPRKSTRKTTPGTR
jgi:PAS domain S-box-containing protein